MKQTEDSMDTRREEAGEWGIRYSIAMKLPHFINYIQKMFVNKIVYFVIKVIISLFAHISEREI